MQKDFAIKGLMKEKKMNKDVKYWIRGEEYGGPPDRE